MNMSDSIKCSSKNTEASEFSWCFIIKCISLKKDLILKNVKMLRMVKTDIFTLEFKPKQLHYYFEPGDQKTLSNLITALPSQKGP